MRYKYTAAWRVIGGVNIREDNQTFDLASTATYRFLLANDSDECLLQVDESSAIKRLLMSAHLPGGTKDIGSPELLRVEMQTIRAERKKRGEGAPVLVFEATGNIDTVLKGRIHETEHFIVTFDAIDKDRIRKDHQTEVEAMKMAIALESKHTVRFARLADCVCLFNEAGKAIHSFTFSVGAVATVSQTLSHERGARISQFFNNLNKIKELDSVERLFCQMAEHRSDKPKAFLFGWMALEILIQRSFNHYQESFLSPLMNADQPKLREQFLDQIKKVMQGKYRLTDKFILVTAAMFPLASELDAENDFALFQRLKEMRDNIIHGNAFSEENLPLHDLDVLLRKYVTARIS